MLYLWVVAALRRDTTGVNEMTNPKPLTDKQIATALSREQFDNVFDNLAMVVTGFTVKTTAQIVDAVVAAYNGNLVLKATCHDFILSRGRFGGDKSTTAKSTHIHNFAVKHSVHYAQLNVANRRAEVDKLKADAIVEVAGFDNIKVRDLKSSLKNIRDQVIRLYKAMAGLHNVDNIGEVTVNPASNQVCIRYKVDGTENLMLQYGEDLMRKAPKVPGRGAGKNPADGANIVQCCSALSSLLAAHPADVKFSAENSSALSHLLASLIALNVETVDPDQAITSTEGDVKMGEAMQEEAKRQADAA